MVGMLQGPSLRRLMVRLPNVLAPGTPAPSWSSSGRRARRWCSSGGCGWPCSGPRPISASTSPPGAVEAYEKVRRRRRPRLDRGPGAGHPPRREGPHRGVLRPRRLRADPQGHDQPGPHRERRAAPGRGLARARPRPDRRRPRPPRPPGHRARRRSCSSAAATTSPPRPRRSASASPPAPRSCSLAHERLDALVSGYPLRGIKGPMGTAQDQLDLLGGDPAKLAALEAAVARHLGFDRVLDSVGQVYPRSLDLDVVAALVQAAAGPSSLATTIRLMAGHELATEGFRPGQVGSSAMPHKMNSRSCERINGLAVVLRGHLSMVAELAGDQWNEGDVSLLRRAPGGAARRLLRLRRPLPDLPDRARRARRLPGRRRRRARPLPAVPRHHEGAGGRGAARGRPRGGPRGHQGARRRRRPGDAGGGRSPAATSCSTASPATSASASRGPTSTPSSPTACRSPAPPATRSPGSSQRIERVVAADPESASYDPVSIL